MSELSIKDLLNQATQIKASRDKEAAKKKAEKAIPQQQRDRAKLEAIMERVKANPSAVEPDYAIEFYTRFICNSCGSDQGMLMNVFAVYPVSTDKKDCRTSTGVDVSIKSNVYKKLKEAGKVKQQETTLNICKCSHCIGGI